MDYCNTWMAINKFIRVEYIHQKYNVLFKHMLSKAFLWGEVISLKVNAFFMDGTLYCFCTNINLMSTSVCYRLANTFFISYSLGQASK